MTRKGRRAVERTGWQPWALAGALAFVAVVVVIIGATREPGEAPRVEADEIAPAFAPSLGNLSAPVTLVAFERPLCPSCRFFHVGRGDGTSTFEQIAERYVVRGQVRYVERIAFLSEGWDEEGAALQKCTWHARPDLFFPLVEDLYRDQARISKANFDSYVTQWAASNGWDGEVALGCARENPHRGEITQDIRAGRAAGVSGTPTFIVVAPDGTSARIVGAQPFQTFAEAIENALDRA